MSAATQVGLLPRLAKTLGHSRLPAGPRRFPTLDDIRGQSKRQQFTRIWRNRSSPLLNDHPSRHLVSELWRIMIFVALNNVRVDKYRRQSRRCSDADGNLTSKLSRESPPDPVAVFREASCRDQISRFETCSAFFSMNSRRGSTASPISVVKMSSAATASSMRTCNRRLVSGLMVVSHNCSGFSPMSSMVPWADCWTRAMTVSRPHVSLSARWRHF